MDRFSGLLRGVEKTNLGIGEKAIREVEVVLLFKVQLGCEIKLVIVAVLAAGGARVCSLADPGCFKPIRIPVQDFAGRSRGIQPVQKKQMSESSHSTSQLSKAMCKKCCGKGCGKLYTRFGMTYRS